MSKTSWMIKLLRLVLKKTYGKWILHHYDVHLKGYENIPIEGPFLIIGNHSHTYDSLFLSASMPLHIHWVMGAYLFKIRFLHHIFDTLLQGIAKQQGKSDLQTIKGMRTRLNEGGVVAFFPEGTRTWDGESIPVNNATAKLIRIFNVPVVIVHFEGAFGSKPRWTLKRRKGPITIRVVKVIQKEELHHKSVEEVAALVNTHLVHSYDEWQQEHHIPYVSSTKALGIENILYACPTCHSFSTIQGEMNKFTCISCKSQWELNEYDEILPLVGSSSYTTIATWHNWELSYVKELLNSDSKTPLFNLDDGVLFQQASPTQLILLSKDFSITATSKAFILQVNTFEMVEPPFNDKKIVFYFDDINSIAINAKSTLEFSHGNTIYRVRIKSNQSILKYMELYQLHQKMIIKESV